MKTRTPLQLALCALGLTALSGPALAANVATVSMGPLRFELEDLAPDDGIAPQLSWLSRKSEAFLFIEGGLPQVPSSRGPLYQSDTGVAEPGTVNLSEQGATARVSPQGASIEVAIPTNDGKQVQVLASEFSEFTLTPNTRVQFFTDVKAMVELDIWKYGEKYLYRGIANIEQGGHDGSSWAVGLDRIFFPSDDVRIGGSHTLSWFAQNDSGEDLVLAVNPRLRVVMDNWAVTVPEPAAVAQTLAGLLPVACVAGLARRRLSRASHG